MHKVFQLPELCTVVEVEPYYQELAAIVTQQQNVEIDASKVERIDTAFIQLLIALEQNLQKSGTQFRYGKRSEMFNNACRILGYSFDPQS
ncbi:STAS domain-containing protein [Catenovulum agarivorans]|uniref:STAS domain-containing protein n=1 Tax=Catenovulum agarivorans TaxID=1172192 RepID=UPI0003078E09|nr:STAS domain-containing protein [Catenovulum agarivorans]